MILFSLAHRRNTLAAVLPGLVWSGMAFTAMAAGHEDFDACGHKGHDSLEARAQAGTRTYWHDDHASDPQSWVRFKILGFNDFHGNLEQRTL